jgi:hypothetical protein
MANIHIKVEPGTITVDQAKFDVWARDPNGPLLKDLVRRGNNVESTARFDAPRRTGLLASTIRTQTDFSGRLPSVEVIAGRDGATPYVGYVLNGTRAHIIRPIQNRPNAHLRFLAGGRVVFAKQTFHPGTRADPFLQRALLRAAD